MSEGDDCLETVILYTAGIHGIENRNRNTRYIYSLLQRYRFMSVVDL